MSEHPRAGGVLDGKQGAPMPAIPAFGPLEFALAFCLAVLVGLISVLLFLSKIADVLEGIRFLRRLKRGLTSFWREVADDPPTAGRQEPPPLPTPPSPKRLSCPYGGHPFVAISASQIPCPRCYPFWAQALGVSAT